VALQRFCVARKQKLQPALEMLAAHVAWAQAVDLKARSKPPTPQPAPG